MPRRFTIAVIVLVLFAVLALIYGRIIIQNDGITYYALTRSLVIDGDFDLSNESTYLTDLRLLDSEGSGRSVAVYSCGYPYLYSPLLWIFNKQASLSAWRPYSQNAFFPFSHSLAIFIGSVLFGLLTFFLGIQIAKRDGAGPWMAFFVNAAIFLGTPLAFYTFATPSFPHAADSFITTAAFLVLFSGFKGRNVLVGFLLGLSVLLRNVNIVFLPPMLLILLYLEHKQKQKPFFLVLAEVFAGALPAIVALFYYNWTQYGNPIMTSYGPYKGEMPTLLRRIYLISISPSLGIFVWSPITLLSFAGLIAGSMRRKPAFLLALCAIILFCAFTCIFALIFPGASFGHRYFTHFYPFWVSGLTELLLVLRRKLIVPIAALAVLWTFLLFNVYFITFASTPARRALGEDPRRLSPAKMLRLAGNVNETQGSNIFRLWYSSLCAQPYPTILGILENDSSKSN